MKKWLQSDRSYKYLKHLAYLLWAGAIGGVLLALFTFIFLANDDLPSFEDLENPKYDLASIVYASDGEAFGKYYIENREPIEFEELSPHIRDALLSIEDSRFYSHAGIDFRALVRVAVKTVLLRHQSSGGGSTITQQLSKLLFERPNLRGKNKISAAYSLVKVKLKEWITAVKLEKSYTKEEIIAMYLNKFEFINGAHGLQAAAQTYFGKPQDELEIEEAATLIGMLKNPALYNPRRFPDKAKFRRNIVLSQMNRNGVLDQEAFDTLSTKEVDMSNFKRDNHSEGPAPYFRAELTKWLQELFAKEEFYDQDGQPFNIYTDGLKIYTTIDLNYQKHAEEAVLNHMKWNQDRYWKAWRGMNMYAFEADARQREIRKEGLRRRVRSSDRYISLFTKIMSSSLQKAQKEYKSLPLGSKIIEYIMGPGDPEKGIRNLLRREMISRDEADQYRQLVKSSYWSEINDQWQDFSKQYESEFNAPIQMKVFALNEEGEEIKEMSPLDSIEYHYRFLQSGLLAMEPGSGHIKAWVGGIGHKYFKYDHINMRRQVGSTIKPFVYSTAIAMQGISPCQEYDDIQYSIAPGDASFYLLDEWTPSNANGTFTGNKYNLYQGLLYSKNSITVRLVKEMGNVDPIRELLNNVGIEKDAIYANGQPVVPRLPSICLGAMDLTVMEMTGAYGAFANNGIYTQPVFVTHIEDKNGKVIYRAFPNKRQALNPLYNGIMVDMLRNNTGGRFGLGVKSENGGKTGTTNDYADGWFMGITPSLVVGTWVGGEDKWIRFYTLDDGQGYVMARPIFIDFIKKLEADPESQYDFELKFQDPPLGYNDYVNCDKYKQQEPEEEREEILQRRIQRDEFEEDFEEGETEEGFDEGQ